MRFDVQSEFDLKTEQQVTGIYHSVRDDVSAHPRPVIVRDVC